jgi:O-antigen/teichoic acid export membrane protein
MSEARPEAAAWRERSIATKGMQALLLRGGEVAAQAGLIVITARFLGPEGRGLYALALLAATLCVVPLGSVWSAFALDVAKHRIDTGRVLTMALVIAAVGGTVVAVIGVIVSIAFDDRWWVVALPAGITPVLLFLAYAQGIYQALGHVVAANAIYVARVASPLVFLAGGLALGAGSRVVVLLWAASMLVLAPPFFVHLSAVAGRPSRPSLRLRPYAHRLALGIRLLPGNTALLLNVRVGLIVLAALSTTAAVGVYSVAVAGSELLRVASRAVYSATFAAIGGRDENASAALTVKAVRHSMLLAAASSLLIVPASFVAAPILFGPGFGDVPLLLALLVPANIAFALFPALTAFFGVQLVRPELVSGATAVMLGLSALTMFAAVPGLGNTGAALGTSTGAVLGVGYLVWRFLRATGRPLRDLAPTAADLREYVQLAARLSPGFRTSSAPRGAARVVGKVPPA